MRNYIVWWVLDDLESFDVVKAIDPYSARLSFQHKNPGVKVDGVWAE